MNTINGRITSIDTERSKNNFKKVVTLEFKGHQKVFVEFQGSMVNELVSFKEKDRVEITIKYNGKVSNLGHRYNNLIALSIRLSN